MTSSPDTIYFQIAGFNICINFHETEWTYIRNKLKDEIVTYLKSFLINAKPTKTDYQIDIIWEQELKILYFKKEKTAFLWFYKKKTQNNITTTYAISIVEFCKLLTQVLSDLLLKNKGFLLHSSAAKIRSKADIFLGPSGAGKSTIAGLLKDRFHVLSDDISIIRKENGKYYLYQTPFVDKAFWIKNQTEKYPLGRIFFLEKSKDFEVVKVKDKKNIIRRLLMLYEERIFNKKSWQTVVNNILDFAADHDDFYNLHFPKDGRKINI